MDPRFVVGVDHASEYPGAHGEAGEGGGAGGDDVVRQRTASARGRIIADLGIQAGVVGGEGLAGRLMAIPHLKDLVGSGSRFMVRHMPDKLLLPDLIERMIGTGPGIPFYACRLLTNDADARDMAHAAQPVDFVRNRDRQGRDRWGRGSAARGERATQNALRRGVGARWASPAWLPRMPLQRRPTRLGQRLGRLGPRGRPGEADPAEMTPQGDKKTPRRDDPGHTA